MISDELKAIVDQLQIQGKTYFQEGATAEAIATFEQEKQIVLPNGIKEWLMFSDGGELFLPAGIQLYGVCQKPLIDVNDNDRPGDNYTVIGALSTGDPILCEKDSERISIYNHGAGRIEDDETYPDFFAFLTDLHDLLGMGG